MLIAGEPCRARFWVWTLTMIQARDLVKSYPGATAPIIKGLSCAVAQGDVLWVSGPSGSGKSTLLNLLGLLTEADSGSLQINGAEMLGTSRTVRTHARATLVSTIFQRGNLFAHVNALDNVLVGMPTANRDEAEAHLRAVGLGEKARQPAGLLSGGEQARVAIARATARRTPILLADEPIAGLDDRNADMVMVLLAEAAAQGAAVVVVSHDERTAKIATTTLRLMDPAA